MKLFRAHWLPWLVLALALGITWLVWDHERQVTQKELKSQFDFALRENVSRIEQRAAAYEQMLRGVQGLLASTALTDRQAIQDYVDTLQLDANFAGIQLIGIAAQVPASQKQSLVAEMHQRGVRDFAITPPGERDAYAVVIQREPNIGRIRQTPLGRDVWAEPQRREAMENARDSGRLTITGKVQLAVDDPLDASPGFIMYLPVFGHGQLHDTVAQRRDNIVGWVFASFRMSDFMASMYGRPVAGISMAIYDDVATADKDLMYAYPERGHTPSAGLQGALHASEYIVVGNHTWTLTLGTLPGFEAQFGGSSAVPIGLTGVLISALIATLVWLMVTSRARALRLATAMTEELRLMAQRDPLTQLPNRALFGDRLQTELTRAKRSGGQFAMMYLDLDRFKPVNDNFGHAVGDVLLQEVALRLKNAVRTSDTVGRIGGDEFVVLVPGLSDPVAALAFAEKIRRLVREPYRVGVHMLEISCCLGVAIYPKDGTDEITLSASADTAMYRAKEMGRDGVLLASPY